MPGVVAVLHRRRHRPAADPAGVTGLPEPSAGRSWPATWSASSASRSPDPVTEERLPGRGRRRARHRRLRPAARRRRPRGAARRRRCCSSPTPAPTSPSTMPGHRSTSTSSTAARSSSASASSTSGSPRAPSRSAAAAARWEADGRLTYWASNQHPHGAKTRLAGLFGLEGDQVQVIDPDVGGGFGAKIGLLPRGAPRRRGWPGRSGRPLRWTETRSESHGRPRPRPGPGPVRRDGRHAATATCSRPTASRWCRTPAPIPTWAPSCRS